MYLQRLQYLRYGAAHLSGENLASYYHSAAVSHYA